MTKLQLALLDIAPYLNPTTFPNGSTFNLSITKIQEAKDSELRFWASNIVTDAMNYCNTQTLKWVDLPNYHKLDTLDKLVH